MTKSSTKQDLLEAAKKLIQSNPEKLPGMREVSRLAGYDTASIKYWHGSIGDLHLAALGAKDWQEVMNDRVMQRGLKMECKYGGASHRQIEGRSNRDTDSGEPG